MSRRMKTLDHRVHSTFEWILERLPSRLGKRVRKATGGRFGIGSQVVVGLGGGVVLTISAIVLALLLMSIVNSQQREITEAHMPALVAAFEVAQRSAELVRASPRMLSATDAEDLEEVIRDVFREEDGLRVAVAEVMRAEGGGDVQGEIGASVVPLVDSLLESIDEIHELVGRRMAYQERLEELEAELATVSFELQLQVEEEIDDQHFFMYTGLRELDEAPAPVSQRRTNTELGHYEGLLSFKAYQNEVTALIAQAMTEDDPEVLRANRERVETALSDVVGAVVKIRPRIRTELQLQVDALEDLYEAPGGVFETRTAQLAEDRRAEDLVTRNQQTTADLVARVEGLVSSGEASTQEAASRSGRLVRLGFWGLLSVTVLTIAMAYGAWKFFGERLLVRMGRLSSATRQMSKGDLDVQVRIEGNDELTDMAGALEVFRQHAVEVQRLNLVEKLAAEVQAKNSELEDTLENLRRTQQQVVKQEKLASLGALTAGIAHEIRNPLNFVNNFAALSSELIEELREELDGDGNGDGKMDREFIAEVLDDLNTNVVKVNEHGMRANRIVEGMLAHSREAAGNPESVDINLMVQEYAKLAYHGIRGTDSSFNVDMIYEFDSRGGEVEAIARDLSRVFLNIVTNACHATNARRSKSDNTYLPTITIRTEGRENEVCVTIRDNGTGIPEEIVSKIFDPFFTTKSGTEGTGLGLSISHEIVQEHGGKIEVDTEMGEFTEFKITLPRKSYASSAAAS